MKERGPAPSQPRYKSKSTAPRGACPTLFHIIWLNTRGAWERTNHVQPSKTTTTSGAKPTSCCSMPPNVRRSANWPRPWRVERGFEPTNLAAEEDDAFDSLTLHSPQDYAAMDISFLDGEEVQQQVRDRPTSPRSDRHRSGRAARGRPGCRRATAGWIYSLRAGRARRTAQAPTRAMNYWTQAHCSTCWIRWSSSTGGIGIDPQSGTVM